MKKNYSTLVNKNQITSIAIGGFDGMHLAHQKLFEQLDENGAIVTIESGYSNLTPKTNRQEYTKLPIYYYVLENIKHLDGQAFIKLIKEEFPNLKKIVIGFDFCFGKNRKHNVKDLKELFKGEVVVINEISLKETPIHSGTIRSYIKEGKIVEANELLGKNYKISGTHIKGQGLGNKSFVPTINLNIENFLLPNEGVYATKTVISNETFESITFLGHRITTDGSYAVETHILDKEIKNQHHKVEILFFKKLRDNAKFESFELLKKQIDLDIKMCKEYFNKE